MNREEFKYAIIQQLDKNMDSFKYLLLEGDVVKKNTFNGYPYAKLQRYISKNYSLEILFELINWDTPVPLYEVTFNKIDISRLDEETWLKMDLTHYWTQPTIYKEAVWVEHSTVVFCLMKVLLNKDWDYKFSHRLKPLDIKIVYDFEQQKFLTENVEEILSRWNEIRQSTGYYVDLGFHLGVSNQLINLANHIKTNMNNEVVYDKIRRFHSFGQNMKGTIEQSSMNSWIRHLLGSNK